MLDGHAVMHLGRFEASFRRHPVRIPGNIDEFIAQAITSINLFFGEPSPTGAIIILLTILSNAKNKAIGKVFCAFPIAFVNIT